MGGWFPGRAGFWVGGIFFLSIPRFVLTAWVVRNGYGIQEASKAGLPSCDKSQELEIKGAVCSPKNFRQ